MMMANFKSALSQLLTNASWKLGKGGNALRWPFDEWDEVFEAAVRPDAEQGVLMIILGLMTASLVTCHFNYR